MYFYRNETLWPHQKRRVYCEAILAPLSSLIPMSQLRSPIECFIADRTMHVYFSHNARMRARKVCEIRAGAALGASRARSRSSLRCSLSNRDCRASFVFFHFFHRLALCFCCIFVLGISADWDRALARFSWRRRRPKEGKQRNNLVSNYSLGSTQNTLNNPVCSDVNKM